jgi:hypothetical protein
MENFDKENATNFLKNAMSRRGFLGAAGAVAATGALAACGTGGSTPAPASSGSAAAAFPTDVSDTEKIVRWANWPLYLDYDDAAKTYPTLDAFAAASGLTPQYKEEIDSDIEVMCMIFKATEQSRKEFDSFACLFNLKEWK